MRLMDLELDQSGVLFIAIKLILAATICMFGRESERNWMEFGPRFNLPARLHGAGMKCRPAYFGGKALTVEEIGYSEVSGTNVCTEGLTNPA